MSKFAVCSLVFAVVFLLQDTECSLLKQWNHHIANVQRFKCQDPQPRSVELRDLMDSKELSGIGKILPSSTVLYRCDSAGCCPTNQRCTAVDSQEVDLVFGLIDRGIRYIQVKADNHTKCACQDYTDRPK